MNVLNAQERDFLLAVIPQLTLNGKLAEIAPVVHLAEGLMDKLTRMKVELAEQPTDTNLELRM